MLQPQTNAADSAMLQPNLQNAAGQVPMVPSFQPENNMVQPNQPGMMQPNQPGMMQPSVGQPNMMNPGMNNQVSFKFIYKSKIVLHFCRPFLNS